jgi:hypothetical protein
MAEDSSAKGVDRNIKKKQVEAKVEVGGHRLKVEG